MNPPTPLLTVSPKKRLRWFGPLCFVVLLVALVLQYRQTAQLRRAMDELRLAEQGRALNAVTEDSEVADLRRQVLELRNELARLQTMATDRSDQPGGPVPSPGDTRSEAVDWVRWAALPGSQVIIEGTSSIHDWTVKGSIIGGFFEVEPAFLTAQPVPSAWTNQAVAQVQVRIPVRSLRSQTLVGASKMDEIMQEAMRMKENPDVLYRLRSMKAKDATSGQDTVVKFDTVGELTVAGVTNAIDIEVQMRRLETNRLRFSGVKTLKMTDFKIPPPSPKFPGGDFIKTGDEVTIRFDWLTGSALKSKVSEE
ncbi:MAG TPA: YceI family protein [Verrucomicrobiota bacterium]|nr:YceI family protein [Verrucomicrobiota bacterium]